MKVKVIDGLLTVNGKDHHPGAVAEIDDSEFARLDGLGVVEKVGRGEVQAEHDPAKKSGESGKKTRGQK